MSMTDDTRVKNIYEDEQEKLDDMVKEELEMTFKISSILSDYGYVMEPTMVDGLPEIKFTKA